MIETQTTKQLGHLDSLHDQLEVVRPFVGIESFRMQGVQHKLGAYLDAQIFVNQFPEVFRILGRTAGQNGAQELQLVVLFADLQISKRFLD